MSEVRDKEAGCGRHRTAWKFRAFLKLQSILASRGRRNGVFKALDIGALRPNRAMHATGRCCSIVCPIIMCGVEESSRNCIPSLRRLL
jgi:hypothetical protein